MKILEVKNLKLGINTENGLRPVLNNISFSLEKGKTHAIVGESGCGKTLSAMSILKLLPKTAKITGGQILYKGEDLVSYPEKEMRKIRGAKIALIPQDPMTSLNPLYTIGDQLLEVIKIHQNLSGEAATKKAIEALKMVQIPSPEDRIKAYPHEFSGGMKQRAIIAMALACEAEIIIADEPTTALDVTIQAQIMKLLDDIKKTTGTSILIITHDLALVENVADEVSVMYSGEIVENAPVKEFFANTNHPYSKALLKSVPSKNRDRLYMLPGQPPNINQTITGCKFHPRCEFAFDRCSIECPNLINIAENHCSKCFLNE